MPISWNEIKSRAIAFSKEWRHDKNEDAEGKSFWDDFFNVFGISRRRVATFEQQVKKLSGQAGYIDLLWKGTILVEHKSRGKNLDKAYEQAKDYFPGLKENELPQYILVSDFQQFRLYNLDSGTQHDFQLDKFVDNVHLFGFIAGYQKRTYKEQDPVNIEAAELMGKLHDKLKTIGYQGHDLEVYLVRLVFLLFADDTNVWEKGILYDYLDLQTREDGSDLAIHLSLIFEILNTPINKRLKNIDETLSAFPYINGKLFEEHLPIASFDSEMRKILIDCCELDWGKISPAIFGSLFQSVMDEKARRNLGAHYTSEKNILKLIKPLFLDELWHDFKTATGDKKKLQRLHERISRLRFLDPACGCGNFLIIAYRELRLLEMEIIQQQLKGQTITDISSYFTIDVDLFYGIEFEEFPAQIAQVAMWLIDHQMNMKASETFGEYYVRLPLNKSATIIHGNALLINWQNLIESKLSKNSLIRFNYIFGNPPFIGSKLLSKTQRSELENIFRGVKGAGVLDYVCGWYLKSAAYMQESTSMNRQTKTGYVSTSSITQGEQVGILWNELFNKYNIKIHFSHRTFKWSNEAKGNAAVHVVIIGFSNFDINDKYIYTYENIKGEPHQIKVKNINPYLVEGDDVFLQGRSNPICNVPRIGIGNKPIDGGNYLFTESEKDDFIRKEKNSEKYFKVWLGADEFLNGYRRHCLWLGDADPRELRMLPEVVKRIEAVRKFRMASKSAPTQKLAEKPTRFHVENIPKSSYLVIPKVSSEKRKYIPIGYLDESVFSSDLLFILGNGTLYHFGILSSIMHMSWIKHTCGRLESRFRYSKDIVYNNFPWPNDPSMKQIKSVEEAAGVVLELRDKFPGSSLADLYDPIATPLELIKAHQTLDKAVDLCYRPQPFPNESKRIEYLFELYEMYTVGLFGEKQKK